MAAQRLTRARLVQISITMVCLITAFIWGTYSKEVQKGVSCSKNTKCELFIGETHLLIETDNEYLYLKTESKAHLSVEMNGVPQKFKSKYPISDLLQLNVIKISSNEDQYTQTVRYTL